MVEYVSRDGQRLTPWMNYCVQRFSDAMQAKFGVRILVSSGIRTNQEQRDIFLRRYVTAGNVRGRRVYDTRVWSGTRYYRIDSAGTVAVPGTSNHEIQGSRGAVDLRDTGSDAGITSANNARSNWARANAHLYGLTPEGYNFREPWHFSISDIFRAAPGGGGGARPAAQETKNEGESDVTVLYTAQNAAKKNINILANAGLFWMISDAEARSLHASGLPSVWLTEHTLMNLVSDARASKTRTSAPLLLRYKGGNEVVYLAHGGAVRLAQPKADEFNNIRQVLRAPVLDTNDWLAALIIANVRAGRDT